MPPNQCIHRSTLESAARAAYASAQATTAAAKLPSTIIRQSGMRACRIRLTNESRHQNAISNLSVESSEMKSFGILSEAVEVGTWNPRNTAILLSISTL